MNAIAQKPRCSLLVQNAHNLILEVIDYDSTGCVVHNPGSNFDEIAGQTKSNNDSLGSTYSTGIVSVHSTTKGNFPAYYYKNKVESLDGSDNDYTMYFYDVFQRLDASGVTLDATLDTETEVLLGDILHYASTGIVWGTFNAYFGEAKYSSYNSIYWDAQFKFAGNLDLSTISYYPAIHASGKYDCSNAVFKFDA